MKKVMGKPIRPSLLRTIQNSYFKVHGTHEAYRSHCKARGTSVGVSDRNYLEVHPEVLIPSAAPSGRGYPARATLLAG